MTGDDKEKLREGLDRVAGESLHRIENAVANLETAVDAEFPIDTVGEQVVQMKPSGPTEPASGDIDGLMARIDLLHRDDGRAA